MNKPRALLAVTYWSLEEGLIQAYTLPYLRLILQALPASSTIHLVTLEKDPAALAPAQLGAGIVHHPFRYAPFGMRGAAMALRVVARLLRLARKERIDGIHAWCTPAGSLGLMLSWLLRRPLVIDSYEPHADAMVENGTWPRGGVAHRLLLMLERWQSRRASHLIACAEGMRAYAHRRYGLPADRRMEVKPACVDLDRFAWSSVKDAALLRELSLEDKVVAVYAGKFGGIYLEDESFRLLRAAHDHWGDRLRVLLLTGHTREELEPMIRRAGLDPSIFIVRLVPHAEVPRWMGLADFAITPVKPVPTKALCTPIKDGEYWALGLPVIITPGISDDSRIIAEEGIGAVLDGLSDTHFRAAIRRIAALIAANTRREIHDRIRPVAERYRSFAIARSIYQRIYGS
jgi:hypothetical protein